MTKPKHAPGPLTAQGTFVNSPDKDGCIASCNNIENATLFAAAPDMLEFLEELEDQPGILHEDNCAIKRLIKKAKGE